MQKRIFLTNTARVHCKSGPTFCSLKSVASLITVSCIYNAFFSIPSMYHHGTISLNILFFRLIKSNSLSFICWLARGRRKKRILWLDGNLQVIACYIRNGGNFTYIFLAVAFLSSHNFLSVKLSLRVIINIHGHSLNFEVSSTSAFLMT